MLKIIRNPFGSTAHRELCEKIRALTDEKTPSLLIVPEQQTVLAESEMAELLPPSAPLYFEATNFTRLANTVFRALGGVGGEYCDAGRRSLIMWRTLTELSPVLAMTSGRREINAGLVERALGAIKEMESAGVAIDELSNLLYDKEIEKDKRLADKLGDLTKIYSLYKRLLTEKYTDTAEDVDAMAKKLREHPDFLADREIFIEGFTSFTEPQYALIALLATRTNVSVYFTASIIHREEFPFTEIREAEERLITKAKRAGSEIKIETVSEKANERSQAIDALTEVIWSKTALNDNITLQNSDEIRIFEASSPFDECAFIAADIKRRVMLGEHYSDFAIISRDLAPYVGILDCALICEGVPAFISKKRDLSSFELIKLIYTAYSTVLRGYTREDVITYAKCGLTGLSHAECDELEAYINTWSLSGTRFTDGIEWNMNPAGYTTRKNEIMEEKLGRINASRNRLIEPLFDFEVRLKDAKTVKEHAEVLFRLLSRLDAEKKLAERAAALLAFGEGEFAEENSRLWSLVCDTLDVLVEVSGDMPTDADGFLSQLKILFANSDIARIPSTRDCVTVGSAEMLRLRERKHLYLIGVNAGKFPAAVSESSYFTEQDKLMLSARGLAVFPELEKKSARELYVFMRAISYAQASLTLSYSSRDTRQKASEPSEPIKTVERLTKGAVKPVRIASLAPDEKLFSPTAALELSREELGAHYDAVKRALIENGYADALRISEGSITNEKARLSAELCHEIFSGPLALTQSKIDAYSACPLAYFCKFTVGLREEEIAEFDASGIGTFIHAILENFFSSLVKDGIHPSNLSEEDKKKLTRSAAEKYLGELGNEMNSASAKTRIKLDNLCRAAMPVVDGLCEEFSTSLFEPRFFELAINKKNPDSPEPIVWKPEGEEEIFVYGIIDRVDTYKSGNDVYVRVVDYKTGQKTFSPTDVEEGKNLQMFLYLKAILESEKESFRSSLGLEEGGRAIPAGVIYVKTSVKDVRVDRPSDEDALTAFKEAQGREGMVLGTDEVISAMGVRYTPLSTPKKPDVIAESRRKFMFDEPGFEEIMKSVEGSVLGVAKEIRSGKIDASPRAAKSGALHCEYCEFKPICRIAKTKK